MLRVREKITSQFIALRFRSDLADVTRPDKSVCQPDCILAGTGENGKLFFLGP